MKKLPHASILADAPSHAALVTATATGTLFDVGSAASTVFSVGAPFTLTFTYESSYPADFTTATATEASYRAVTGYSLVVGAAPSAYSGIGTTADLGVINNSGANSLDAFQFDNGSTLASATFPDVAGAGLQYLYLNISNLGGSPLDSTALPTSIHLAGFSNRRLQIAWQAPFAYVQGTVTSLTFIPEPASSTLVAAGLSLSLLRRKRVKSRREPHPWNQPGHDDAKNGN